MADDIRNALKTYLTNDILNDPDYPLGDEEALISSGLINSFSLVDIALWVEGHYGVRIDDSQLTADNFDTIAAFADYIVANR